MGSLYRGSCGGHIVRTHCLRGRQMFGKTKGPIPAEDRDDVLSVRAAHDAGHDPLANVRDVDHPVLVSLLRLAVHCGVGRLDTVAHVLCGHLLPYLRDFAFHMEEVPEFTAESRQFVCLFAELFGSCFDMYGWVYTFSRV